MDVIHFNLSDWVRVEEVMKHSHLHRNEETLISYAKVRSQCFAPLYVPPLRNEREQWMVIKSNRNKTFARNFRIEITRIITYTLHVAAAVLNFNLKTKARW
jgi:hypothetical protein